MSASPSAGTPGVFVTGTDTGVGKTLVTLALLHALRADGVRALAMKPVASGGVVAADGTVRNDDALALHAGMAGDAPPYALVNPVALREPIAPHLAAAAEGREIALPPLRAAFEQLRAPAEAVLVEGVGGWAVPLSATLMQADLARALGLPVLLVVGVRLGCISHALLTARAIRGDGLALAGWIASDLDPALPRADEAVAAIASRIEAPLLGRVPHAPAAHALVHAVQALRGGPAAQLLARRTDPGRC